MAALGWLLNLDFAGGSTEVVVVSVGSPEVRSVRKLRYGYGYRYIAPLLGALWSS